MKIKTRLYIILAAAAFSLFWYVVAAFLIAGSIHSNTTKIEISRNVIKAIFELNTVRSDYQFYYEQRPYQQWHTRYRSLIAMLDSSKSLFNSKKEKKILNSIQFHLQQKAALFGRLHVDYSAEIETTIRGRFREHDQSTVALANKLSNHSHRQMMNTIKWAIFFTMLYMINTLILLVWAYNWVISKVIKPIAHLQKGVKRISDGDLSHKTDLKTKDEIGYLSRIFDELTDKLLQSNEQLSEELEAKIEAENKLRHFNEVLEERVLYRTRELERANRFLKEEINSRSQIESRLKTTMIQMRKINEELLHSNKELEQFAYVSSHDLQEPLRTISNYVDLFLMKFKKDLGKDAEECLSYIQDGSLRALELIRELLAYSSIGFKEEHRHETDMKAVLDRTLLNLKTLIDESGAVIRMDPMPRLMVNETQMIQLFQNLIANAIKYRRKAAPRIHVAAEQQQNTWRFAVSDNGIGIDPVHQQQIFMLFKRLHNRSEYPGTGIGLAVCKKIVQYHGGTIGVMSEPGKGSTFYFSLPITSSVTATV